MNSVTLGISSRETINDRFVRAFQGERQGQFISFASPELLFKVISGKRWDLLKVMTGAGPMTIREAARRMHRDVKAVHGDVQALIKAGLLQKSDTGLIVFPYDEVHVDFMLKAANVEALEKAESVPWREVAAERGSIPASILRAARGKSELTQTKLAELTGIPQRHISEMEQGKRPIGKENARKLATALNVDYRMLM